MSPTIRTLALLFAVLGLGVSASAAYVHYRLLVDPQYVSFCDVSATMSCTQVYASRFGSFAGVPVAVYGAIWFALASLLAAAAFVARPAVRENIAGYLFAGSTVGLSVVLYLGYASFFVLQLVCVLCVATYVAAIGLFLVSGAATSVPVLSLPRRLAGDLKLLVSSPIALGLAVLLVAGSGAALVLFPREGATAMASAGPPPEVTADERSELQRYMAGAPRTPLAVPSEGAKVLIVKFNDYQCPACAQSYQSYKPILAKYAASHPGAVRVVLKDYPLEMECNVNMTGDLHGAACEAAVAVRLAREHGRAEVMEEWLYTHQQGMTPDTVKQAAREIGQVPDFDAKYAAALELVRADIEEGRQLAIRVTPTFFINGVRVDGTWTPQYFDQAIAHELQSAGSN